MTEISLAKDDDVFWGRVRAALAVVRPGARRAREPAYGTAAIARSLGMRTKLNGRIDEALHASWALCAERKVSLCLMVIGIDRFKDLHLVHDRDSIEAGMAAVRDAIARGLPRPGDDCIRHGHDNFVVVLPDFPVLMARSLAGKLTGRVHDLAIPHKESHAGIVTAGIGLTAANPQGSYDRRFFETGAAALAKAQKRGLGRVETIDLRPGQQRKAG